MYIPPYLKHTVGILPAILSRLALDSQFEKSAWLLALYSVVRIELLCETFLIFSIAHAA